MLTLPLELRGAFKEPLGPVTTDTADLLERVDRTRRDHGVETAPLIAVGDVVTYHLRAADAVPDVALIDGKTEREAVAVEIHRALEDAGESRVVVENPPGELSRDLLDALTAAIEAPAPTVIEVVGEEDLAALPAIAIAPRGASVVYGQPGEGMVHVAVTESARMDAIDLLRQFDGDVDAAFGVLGLDGGPDALR